MKKILGVFIIFLSLTAMGLTCSDENIVKECMNQCLTEFSFCTDTCGKSYVEGTPGYQSCINNCGNKRNDCQENCNLQ